MEVIKGLGYLIKWKNVVASKSGFFGHQTFHYYIIVAMYNEIIFLSIRFIQELHNMFDIFMIRNIMFHYHINRSNVDNVEIKVKTF